MQADCDTATDRIRNAGTVQRFMTLRSDIPE